jgi:hypothetical protein
MEIMKRNGRWGVHDWADGYRGEDKADGYNPEAAVTWEEALEDPEWACNVAMTADQR